ncbi:MAG: NAD-dependent epimerase/dehydratase family protein [Acidobacteria bacterium]|nr:NAD-dependent epimerase/dehydratase family protein [Acidobacteriota bacterium]MCA1618595.1 NAD-dependent epimerase/dehydratase family protein [Acidobacteriota bacterium]
MNKEFWGGRRVLVGGGCGFLGSYLTPQLVEAGARVTVVDSLENGSPDNLRPVAEQVEFVRADLRDPGVCDRVTWGQDVVMNLAARAYGMDYSRAHHGDMLVYNLLCTLNPLEAARRNGVERFLVVSSSCVYPDDAPTPTPELDAFTGLPERVNEGYGWAKRVQELAGEYYARDYGMKVTTVRPFNPYGGNYRWTSEDRAHVMPALVKRVLDGEDPLVVWGSGRQRRNFLHASDATRLIMKVVEAGVVATPVNIGYDDDVSIAELVGLICEVAGRAPAVVFDTSKPEGRSRKCADATRLRALTGEYRPRVSLREGVEEMIGWYERTFGRPPRVSQPH